MSIAGHTFIVGRCACGKRWIDVRDVTHGDIGKEGWAHQGSLTSGEYAEIVAERAREELAMACATAGAMR